MAAVLVYIDLATRAIDDHPASARAIDDRHRADASSLQALAAGRQIASSWGATLYAAVIVRGTGSGSRVAGLEDVQLQLARAGADKIIVALTDPSDPLPAARSPIAPLWSALGTAWSGVLDHLRPRLVLFGAEAPATAELGPRTGARIGARLLSRARAVGAPSEIELRDRDGSYVRAGDSGAAVALIGTGVVAPACDADVDVIVLDLPDSDPRIELVGEAPAEVAQTAGILVALGDDALDPGVVAGAQHLTALLGGILIGGPAAARAGAVAHAAVFDRSTPLAPELCIVLGTLALDLSGSTSVIRIGSPSSTTKHLDGAIPGPIADGLEELVRELERA